MDATFGDEPTGFGFITIFRCTKMLNFTVGAYISSTGLWGSSLQMNHAVWRVPAPNLMRLVVGVFEFGDCETLFVFCLHLIGLQLPPKRYASKDYHNPTPPPKKKKKTPQQQIGEKRFKKNTQPRRIPSHRASIYFVQPPPAQRWVVHKGSINEVFCVGSRSTASPQTKAPEKRPLGKYCFSDFLGGCKTNKYFQPELLGNHPIWLIFFKWVGSTTT